MDALLNFIKTDPVAWVAISFTVFVLLAFKYGAKPVLAALDTKIDRIKTDIDTAERLKREAQAILDDFLSRQRDAEQTAGDIVRRARLSAKGVQEAAEADLSESMARREAQLSERLKRIEEQAIADLQNHAADLALKATHEIIVKTLDDKASNRLIDQAVQSAAKYLN